MQEDDNENTEAIAEPVVAEAAEGETGQVATERNALSAEDQLRLEHIDQAIARVRGESITKLPDDLYIPPDALEVFLEAFEGPLDLLLYLIKRHNMDILDIPVAEITRQYMKYISVMEVVQFELAADYLVMAAMLAEIKSRMLLPRQAEEVEEEDPRAELVRRLQEYERFKKAAEDLNDLPRMERDFHQLRVKPPELKLVKPQPGVELHDLLLAFNDVLKRADMYTHHQIQFETLTVRERMSQILSRVQGDAFINFTELFVPGEGRLGVVVTFLAILELLKESLIEIVQTEPFEPIHIKAA